MKKPSLRVTKWLADIPVEAACSICAGVQFQVKPISHRPGRVEYQQSLQHQFDAHVKATHKQANEDPSN
jgi:hypothetical protein